MKKKEILCVFLFQILLSGLACGNEGADGGVIGDRNKDSNDVGESGAGLGFWEYDIGQQAVDTFKRKDVWIPLIGMAMFLAGDFDDDLSEWASEENSLFGSRNRAKNFSDIGRDTLIYGGMLSSVLKIKKNAKDKNDFFLALDFKGAVNGGLGLASTFASTQLLKKTVGRNRPDADIGGDSSNRSFPSGHTSISFWGASVITRRVGRLQYFQDHIITGKVLNFGMYGLAGSVAWGRVEGRRHWPSDVLFGAAIGNFFDNFFPVPKKSGKESCILVTPFKDGFALQFQSRF